MYGVDETKLYTPHCEEHAWAGGPRTNSEDAEAQLEAHVLAEHTQEEEDA